MNESRTLVHWEKVSVLGVKIDALSLNQFLSEIQSYVLHQNGVIISYVNMHAINIAYSLPWFRRFLNESELTFCDGVGLKIAAMLTGQYIHQRFTPPDFMDRICESAITFGWKIYFLGAKPGVAQRAADKLIERFPGLQVQAQHGYFDKIAGSLENSLIVEQINEFQPQILVLGLGMPLQEKWISENLHSIDVKIALSAGALFDYLSGELPRAPRWMTDNGLEWLGRLWVEPGRLWKRYLFGSPLFFWRLFIHHFLGVRLPQ
jgi:N-acetylglucosaminyldiphosphoundecaprenol N-acetyl-beta-D-mannosaminyltransferase